MPVVHKEVTDNMVFHVKIDFRRKSNWVLDGHMTLYPEISLYAGVLSREIIRTAMSYAELNVLDVVAAGTRNAYIQVT